MVLGSQQAAERIAIAMSGHSRSDSESAIELEHEPDFALGAIGVRPSASEIVVAGSIRRVEPRVMQTLVALGKANGAVVSRNELMARCWSGMLVSEDAVTRAIGQARRLADLAPGAFSIETIPKIGYRLAAAAVPPTPEPQARAATPPSPTRAPGVAAPTAFFAVAGVVVIAAAFAVGLTYSLPEPHVEAATEAASLGTPNPAARDRQLRATALMNAGGRENVLRAEQLLREAAEIDPQFHAAREALIIALWSAATFVPERAAEVHAEIAALLDDEIVETPLVWRAHVMRGFQQAAAGDWLGAQRSLDKARSGVPAAAAGTVDALETFLFGSVGRIAAGFDQVARRARDNPVSRDRSRALQQWLDRAGKHEEAQAEYVRSRDLPPATARKWSGLRSCGRSARAIRTALPSSFCATAKPIGAAAVTTTCTLSATTGTPRSRCFAAKSKASGAKAQFRRSSRRRGPAITATTSSRSKACARTRNRCSRRRA
jgi:DNA-binding winged helix-turn-helix (wHTH) protein